MHVCIVVSMTKTTEACREAKTRQHAQPMWRLPCTPPAAAPKKTRPKPWRKEGGQSTGSPVSASKPVMAAAPPSNTALTRAPVGEKASEGLRAPAARGEPGSRSAMAHGGHVKARENNTGCLVEVQATAAASAQLCAGTTAVASTHPRGSTHPQSTGAAAARSPPQRVSPSRCPAEEGERAQACQRS
jgi:hypothetical protein